MSRTSLSAGVVLSDASVRVRGEADVEPPLEALVETVEQVDAEEVLAPAHQGRCEGLFLLL